MATIDKALRIALRHYLTACTVDVNSETPGFEHGTGVVVRHHAQTYIVTAAHILEREPDNEKLRITGRSTQALQSLKKNELPGAVFAGTHGPFKYSTEVRIPIIKRLIGKGLKDIAALKIQNVENYLPYTIPHDLSGQGEADTSEGKPIVICGFPGELALPARHGETGQHGVVVTVCFAWQTISKSPSRLDARVDFVTDFDDNDAYDPKGMSGGGAWTIPNTKDGELWSPHQAQLIGIQSGVYREKKLLGLVSIEQVLDLLSND
jgi:hypothetical protein